MSTNSKPTFNIGDKVICVNASGEASSKLVSGRVYIVTDMKLVFGLDWMITITDLMGAPVFRVPSLAIDIAGWFAHRFISAEPASTNQSAATVAPVTAAVNDYVCPSCGNEKCSKSEGTCWKCGSKL